MVKNGYVVMADEKKAKIRVNRESACGGNCSHCKGCGTDAILFEVENDMNFKSGETVKVIMDDRKFLKKSFLGYGLLVALIIAGGVLGYEIFQNELVSFALMLIFLFLGLFILRKTFKERFSDIKVERF